jgi:iron(III) transport system substrate-binding protein
MRKFPIFVLAAFVGLMAVFNFVPSSYLGLGPAHAGDKEVNLYSYRQAFLLKPLLDGFTKKTGIKVNVVYAKKGMLERLKAEGANSPADAILTVDIGRLNDLVRSELVQPINSKVLNANIPQQFRHKDGLWYGLTARARVLYAHKTRVKPDELTSYEDLAKPRFKGRICTRSGKHVYNISLVASMIKALGEAKAETWAKGVKANLARRPQGNDRAQVKAIYQGECDVSIGNHYYMGKMATNEKKPKQKKWAETVRIIFPNQQNRGTHVNVSGAGVTGSAKNKANAIKLLEYLSGDLGQEIYAQVNFEYPLKKGVKRHPIVASWGDYKPDAVHLSDIAALRTAASKLMDRVGFDN